MTQQSNQSILSVLLTKLITQDSFFDHVWGLHTKKVFLCFLVQVFALTQVDGNLQLKYHHKLPQRVYN